MKKLKSKDYLNFLSKWPCVITGNTEADLHHESVVREFWSSRKKNFDFGAIPISHYLHIEERHVWGREVFWEHYQMTPLNVCISFVEMYIHNGGTDEEIAKQALELLNDNRSQLR